MCRSMRQLLLAMLPTGLLAAACPADAGPPAEAFSYVGRLQSPALYEPPETCCFDLDGDAIVDDAFGSMLGLLATFGGNWQAVVDQGIEDGSLVLLLRWDGLPVALGDGPVGFRSVAGVFQPVLPPLADRLAGLGAAVFDADSAGQPFAGLLSGGNLVAMDGTLRIPGLFSADDGPLAVEVEIDIIEGGLALDAPGCSGICSEDETSPDVPPVRGGLRLGGALHADNYFGALDARYRQCACAGIDPDRPVIEFGEGASAYEVSCSGNTGTPGDCVDDDFCAALGTFCGTVGISANLLDLDRNDNGIQDAFSLGLRVSLSGVTVTGDTTGIFGDGFEPAPNPISALASTPMTSSRPGQGAFPAPR